MNKPVLAIRNIEMLSNEELSQILELADLDLPSSFRLPAIHLFLEGIHNNKTEQAKAALHDFQVRDYLTEKIKTKTGAIIIFHKDDIVDNTNENTNKEKNYLLEKLELELSQNQKFSLMYIGGGHGGQDITRNTDLLSGLSMQTINGIQTELSSKNITFNSCILHSCYSGKYVDKFRSFLDGYSAPLLAYNAESSAYLPHWKMLIHWIKNEEPYNCINFYTDEALASPWVDGDLTLTTAMIATPYINRFVDLTDETIELPGFILKGDDIADLCREEIIHSFKENTSNVSNIIEKGPDVFSDVSIMEDFNVSLRNTLENDPNYGSGASPK